MNDDELIRQARESVLNAAGRKYDAEHGTAQIDPPSAIGSGYRNCRPCGRKHIGLVLVYQNPAGEIVEQFFIETGATGLAALHAKIGETLAELGLK